jgi:glycine hydroxymethyltransferase
MVLSEDPELYNLIKNEEIRQSQGINLIASENFTSEGVMECLGSCLTNKYSEGYPGKRYYGGNKYIDEIEKLCIKRALQLFNLSEDEWGCNVQPYSGSVANLAVYLALLNPGDKLMGLDLPSGGHLTHGFETPKNKVTASATYYTSVSL